MISIIVLTHSRSHLLEQCVQNVLGRTSDLTTEIVIWDNGSTDGTREALAALEDPRIRVVHHPENIGMNAYHKALALTTGDYVVDLDDDVIDAPQDWDRTLLEGFQQLPDVGFLGANLVDNPHDQLAQVMYHERPHEHPVVEERGLRLKLGPVGGHCALTSRELLDKAGGFQPRPGEVFWLEDAEYVEKLAAIGYRSAYLDDLQVTHAGGSYYAAMGQAKHEFWRAYWMKELRKNRVKKGLLLVPGVRRLNERHGWFHLSEIPDGL